MPQPLQTQFEGDGSHAKRPWTPPQLISLSSARAANAKPYTVLEGLVSKGYSTAEDTFNGPVSISVGPGS